MPTSSPINCIGRQIEIACLRCFFGKKMGIFTHACLGTNDLKRAACFYDAALLPLGIANLGPFQEQGLGYGRTVPELLILHPLKGCATSSNGATLGFKAPSRLAVD